MGKIMMSKDDGTYTATYAYPPAADLRRYEGKLHSVTTDFPGEADATYKYGGDGKRRSRVAGAEETWYNWDREWNVVSEEDDADGSSGDLARTYISGANTMEQVEATLADVDGTDPATGDYRYYAVDHLGSVRGLYDQAKSSVASAEYEPYGAVYAASGAVMPYSFTGKPYDGASGLHYFPYRNYGADMMRWITRDPMEMVDGPNVYLYVAASPVNLVDQMGSYGMCAGGRERDTCGAVPWHYALIPQQYPLTGRGGGVANFRQCCWGHDRCYSCSFVPTNTTWLSCDTAMFACNLISCGRTFPWWSPRHLACSSVALVLYLGTIAFSRPLFPEHGDRISDGTLCKSSSYCSFAGN